MDKKNNQDSKTTFDLISKENQIKFEEYIKRGNSYKDKKLFNEAIEMFEKAKNIYKFSENVINSIAECYKEINKIDKAISSYREIWT